MSTQVRKANQLRQLFSTFAFLLMRFVRNRLLVGTPLAKASTGTIRVRLLKVAAILRVSVRRIAISISTAFPLAAVLKDAATARARVPKPAA